MRKPRPASEHHFINAAVPIIAIAVCAVVLRALEPAAFPPFLFICFLLSVSAPSLGAAPRISAKCCCLQKKASFIKVEGMQTYYIICIRCTAGNFFCSNNECHAFFTQAARENTGLYFEKERTPCIRTFRWLRAISGFFIRAE